MSDSDYAEIMAKKLRNIDVITDDWIEDYLSDDGKNYFTLCPLPC